MIDFLDLSKNRLTTSSIIRSNAGRPEKGNDAQMDRWQTRWVRSRTVAGWNILGHFGFWKCVSVRYCDFRLLWISKALYTGTIRGCMHWSTEEDHLDWSTE